MTRDNTLSLLGAIKCSSCNADVDISELGDHVCAPPKALEEPVISLKLQNPNERQGKHTLPPIDPQAANRPFLGRDEPTPRSSSSASNSQEEEASPTTPPDGQPLKQPLAKAPFSPPEDSAASSNYTDTTPPASGSSSAQHLYAPPSNDALYAPVSPTLGAGRSLMEKLTSISPGPFALNSSSPPPLGSNYGGRRPSTSKEKVSEAPQGSYLSSRGVISSGAGELEDAKKARQREEAELRLSGGRTLDGRRASESKKMQDTLGDGRPPTSGSDRSTRSKRSRSSGSDSGRSRNNDTDVPPPVKTDPVPEKPLPSPSYQAYRPPQPPQRIPRSPTLPDNRPVTPSGYPGRPPIKGLRQPIGLPSSPAHGRKQSNTRGMQPKPLAQQGLPNQSIRRAATDGPSPIMEDRSRQQQKGQVRLAPDSRDRSRSRPGTRDHNTDDSGRQPQPPNGSRNDTSPVGSPYNSPPLSASQGLSSSSTRLSPSPSTGQRRIVNNSSRTDRSEIPTPIPYKSISPSPGHLRKKNSAGSVNLSDIDSLMKDLQMSMSDLSQQSPVREETMKVDPPKSGGRAPPPPALQIGKSTQPVEAALQSARTLSPTRKNPGVKSNCRGCSQPIQGKGLTSSDGRLTGRYHKHCFVCQACREPFSSSTFYVWEDLPYCARHYHEKNNSLCKRCDNGIEGPCLETEKSERFHPECFTCVECQRVLGDDYFELNGRPYCEQHAYRLMQQRSRLGPGGRAMQAKMEKRRTRMMMM